MTMDKKPPPPRPIPGVTAALPKAKKKKALTAAQAAFQKARGADSFGKVEQTQFGVLPAASAPPQPSAPKAGEVAPEASQGKWRERLFRPRAVMDGPAIVNGMREVLANAMKRARDVNGLSEELQREWLQYLRQAMEQKGGDAIDAWLLRLLKSSRRPALSPLHAALVAGFKSIRSATSVKDAEMAAKRVIAVVSEALDDDEQYRVSFKQMERELEGKIEIDVLIYITIVSMEDLKDRQQDLKHTLESLRIQVTTMPGDNPDGMYQNYHRLKAELRIIEAEMNQRVPGSVPAPVK